VQQECVSLEREKTAERTRSGTFSDTDYGNRNRSVKKTFCSEILPFNTERPETLWDNFRLQKQRGWGSPLGVYMQQVADSENFWLFWFWFVASTTTNARSKR
jgi:hypothetical protein